MVRVHKVLCNSVLSVAIKCGQVQLLSVVQVSDVKVISKPDEYVGYR
jgi:hypothetical protein